MCIESLSAKWKDADRLVTLNFYIKKVTGYVPKNCWSFGCDALFGNTEQCSMSVADVSDTYNIVLRLHSHMRGARL